MRDSHSPNGLHGLNRDWRLEVETRKNLEGSKGNEYSKGIHLIESDVAHYKRDQGPQVAKGPGKLHLVILIAPQPHGNVFHPLRNSPPPMGRERIEGWVLPQYEDK